MNSRKKTRIVLSVISTGLLSIVCASSQAGRSVRSDASDGAFESLGGFWGSDIEQFGDAGFAAGKTEFKLKIRPSGDARFFNHGRDVQQDAGIALAERQDRLP